MSTEYDPIIELPDYRDEHIDYALAPRLWHLPPDKWKKIHDISTGRGVKVFVGDTGYTKHIFGPNPVASRSFVPGQSVTDGHGHGTHCAGTVLGRYDGDQPIGVAPEADLGVFKCLSNSGSGSSSGIADGIRWAVDNGADVISLSLGGGSSYGPTNQAIDYAFSKGCIVNAAAGNSGYSGRNTVGYPAKYKGCLCCGSYAENMQISNFSSGGEELDWACPGSNIVSFSTNGTGYRTMSGTSMATPYGSGVLALIISRMRSMGLAQWTAIEAVRAFFKANMKDMGAPGFDVRFGMGIPLAEEILGKMQTDGLRFI